MDAFFVLPLQYRNSPIDSYLYSDAATLLGDVMKSAIKSGYHTVSKQVKIIS